MDVDFLDYRMDWSGDGSNISTDYYFTKGLEPECVYYAEPLDPLHQKMQLLEHVCGIKFKLAP